MCAGSLGVGDEGGARDYSVLRGGGGGGESQMFMIDQPQCDRLRRKIIVHAPTPVRHVIQLSLWPG